MSVWEDLNRSTDPDILPFKKQLTQLMRLRRPEAGETMAKRKAMRAASNGGGGTLQWNEGDSPLTVMLPVRYLPPTSSHHTPTLVFPEEITNSYGRSVAKHTGWRVCAGARAFWKNFRRQPKGIASYEWSLITDGLQGIDISEGNVTWL